MNGRLSPFIELGVGFNQDLAARDNVVLNGIMMGLSPREARARYDAVIDFAELREFGIAALVTDPLADRAEAKHEYGVELVSLEQFAGLDGLILAVPHRVLGEKGWDKLFATLAPGGVLVDVKSAVARDQVPQGIHYWSL